MLTYILPCAGGGTRLGLPYPKELHRILPDKSLIDYSLDHIRESGTLSNKVIVVVIPGKEIVSDYVSAMVKPFVRTEMVYFNRNFHEWPGSIKSAEPLFGERNVVLLPDSVLVPADGQSLGRSFAAAFDRGADVAFAYRLENRPEALTKLGALQVVENRVLAFCDKPHTADALKYNAYWTAFGFKKLAGNNLLDLMTQSVWRQQVSLDSLGYKVEAFPIKEYTDLGTWSSISQFLKSTQLSL